MDLIYLVFALAIIGCLLWIVTTKIPMDPMFKLLIQIVVVVAAILWLLRRFGASIPNVL